MVFCPGIVPGLTDLRFFDGAPNFRDGKAGQRIGWLISYSLRASQATNCLSKVIVHHAPFNPRYELGLTYEEWRTQWQNRKPPT